MPTEYERTWLTITRPMWDALRQACDFCSEPDCFPDFPELVATAARWQEKFGKAFDAHILWDLPVEERAALSEVVEEFYRYEDEMGYGRDVMEEHYEHKRRMHDYSETEFTYDEFGEMRNVITDDDQRLATATDLRWLIGPLTYDKDERRAALAQEYEREEGS
jgi:hypothetical protein